MRIGKLDRRISIERATESVNDFGERLVTWSTAFSCWASLTIRKSGSTEKLVDGYESAVRMSEWTLRQSSDIDTLTTADRIVYKSQIHNIIAIHELERGVDVRVIAEIVE